jgi:hypothetical protein
MTEILILCPPIQSPGSERQNQTDLISHFLFVSFPFRKKIKLKVFEISKFGEPDQF